MKEMRRNLTIPAHFFSYSVASFVGESHSQEFVFMLRKFAILMAGLALAASTTAQAQSKGQFQVGVVENCLSL